MQVSLDPSHFSHTDHDIRITQTTNDETSLNFQAKENRMVMALEAMKTLDDLRFKRISSQEEDASDSENKAFRK